MIRILQFVCVALGHRVIHRGQETWTEYGHEYDEWWECTRCKSGLSNVYDESTFWGRVRAWWYDE